MTSAGTTRVTEVTPGSVFGEAWAALLARTPATTPLAHLGLRPGDDLLVVGAHPDDETFGVGATIASLGAAGVLVHTLSLTAGEAALDHVGRHVEGLGGRRAAEYGAACHALGVTSSTIRDFPDGRLGYAPAALASAVTQMIERVRPAHVLTVWWGDPHADHRAVGEATLAVARVAGCPVSGFPVWAPHWLDPSDPAVDGHTVQPMLVDERAAAARERAVLCYRSQTEPVAADLGAIVPPEVARWTAEALVRR